MRAPNVDFGFAAGCGRPQSEAAATAAAAAKPLPASMSVQQLQQRLQDIAARDRQHPAVAEELLQQYVELYSHFEEAHPIAAAAPHIILSFAISRSSSNNG
ncbi:hypothetical protein EPH_0046100 [Eimeria praecox]|uniref:Uncharacterized protein n=1 Tax=Eimeria praecox TaxID=51316 RepID=U6G7Z9_9EIME|nr:hypothetical protein EPH_0046100 [Eimeria praecox]